MNVLDSFQFNRREFIQHAGLASAIGLVAGNSGAKTSGVSIIVEPDDPVASSEPGKWATGCLEQALNASGLRVSRARTADEATPGDFCILAAGPASRPARKVLDHERAWLPRAPEATALATGQVGNKQVLVAAGRDARGLVYSLLDLEDHVRLIRYPVVANALQGTVVGEPANRIRSVTRYFESDVEDKSWYYDKSFWEPYLSMLAAQRFNRFSLAFGLGYNRPRDVHDAYFYFAYPFLFSVPGYNVRVPQLPDEERDRNLEMLRWISEQTTTRGLHFQMALWTQAYQWIESPNANYTIEGLTPDTHAAYCRDALRKLLEEVPAIKGVTLRAHSESGIPEGSYDFWQTIFDGTSGAGRKVEIDIHSKGIEHKLLDMALGTGNPVNVSPKYWAEHMGLPYHQAAIRDEERQPGDRPPDRIETQRRFTRYGYGDYLREDRGYGILYRIWPGTQRFLLWGDPAMAAGYSRYSHFCGSDGLELSDPLSFKGRMGSGLPGGRNAYADRSLEPSGGDWRKHSYTYQLWGRLLYDPAASPESWRRDLRKEFGPASLDCEAALAHASRILPLVTVAHHPSASNNGYWPEIYTDIPIIDEEQRFGTVTTLDPAIFSRVDEFAGEVMAGSRSGRYSPVDVARWLESDARTAERRLAAARSKTSNPDGASSRRWAVDVSAQSGLGLFFAGKLRAAVAWELHLQTGDKGAREQAITHYRLARDAWKQVVRVTDGIYVADVTYGRSAVLRGHWKDRLPAIEKDLQAMEGRTIVPAQNSGSLPPDLDLEALLAAAPLARPRCEHLPPVSCKRGASLSIEMRPEEGFEISRVRLHYRHANQAEVYEIVSMSPDRDGSYRQVIPASYTDSQYPLLYFFELFAGEGRAWIYPGFRADLSNQPYFSVRVK